MPTAAPPVVAAPPAAPSADPLPPPVVAAPLPPPPLPPPTVFPSSPAGMAPVLGVGDAVAFTDPRPDCPAPLPSAAEAFAPVKKAIAKLCPPRTMLDPGAVYRAVQTLEFPVTTPQQCCAYLASLADAMTARAASVDIFHAIHVVGQARRIALCDAISQTAIQQKQPPAVTAHAVQLFDRWATATAVGASPAAVTVAAAGCLLIAGRLNSQIAPVHRAWDTFSRRAGIAVGARDAARASTHVLLDMDGDTTSFTVLDFVKAVIAVVWANDKTSSKARLDTRHTLAATAAMTVAVAGCHVERWSAFRPIDVAATIVRQAYATVGGLDATRLLQNISAEVCSLWCIDVVAADTAEIVRAALMETWDDYKKRTSPTAVTGV